MKLTDNEKRDIVKYMEAGKPLPDKYRFLLFKDDREVELVWNGKTNEVTNVILPFQVIEQIDEPREGKEFGDRGTLFDTSGKQITGEISAPHGNKGCVRALFERALPGQCLGTVIEVQ